MSNSNNKLLQKLLENILLLEDHEYRDDFGPDELQGWDSLATVNIASAIKQTFGFSMTPEEMVALSCIGDIKDFLRRNGVTFD